MKELKEWLIFNFLFTSQNVKYLTGGNSRVKHKGFLISEEHSHGKGRKH